MEHLKTAEANRAFSLAARSDPRFALAYYGLAISAPSSALGRGAVFKAAELAHAGKTTEGERYMIEAIENGAQADAGAALRHLKELVKDFPDDERAHTLLGSLYLSLGNWASATAEYKKAIAINPDLPPPYTQLSLALRMQEKYDEAEPPAKKYIELIPNNTAPLCSYGELLMRQGRFADSIAQYEKALKLDGKLAEAYVGIASDQVFLGKFNDARTTLTTFETEAATVGDRRQAHFWKAVSYLHEGNTKSALGEVQQMYDIAKRGAKPLEMAGDLNLMGVILLDSGEPDAALAKYAEGMAVVGGADVPEAVRDAVHRNNLCDVARVKLAKGDLAGAEAGAKLFRDAVAVQKLPPELCRSHELDGLIAMAKGDASTAVKELEQANLFDPRALCSLGEAYAAAGNAEGAKRAFTHVANFNTPELGYAFVRAKAQAKLKE